MKNKDKKIKTTVWPFQVDNLETWAYWDLVFSKEECKKIIEIGIKNKLSEGTIAIGKDTIGKDKKTRDSKVSWLTPSDELEWMYRRITDVVTELNNRFFKFDLYGFIEGFQFTHYQEPGGKYKKHVDRGLNFYTRKLSLSIQLSDPDSYKGGDLLLYTEEKPITAPREQGKLILFPSFTMHEVKPVTKGERYSLVAWITGPSFK
jgi:PKHD-type hydroxylase